VRYAHTLVAFPLAGSLVAVCGFANGCTRSHTATPVRAAKTATTSPAPVGSDFVAAPASLVADCHRTARAVGYPVPCPTRIPFGLAETGRNGPSLCTLHIIGPGGVGGCVRSWRGWVVGSSETPDAHLVITASPVPLRNDAKVVNGPGWYPSARVKPLRRLTINGWRMRAVYVPPATNDDSAFMYHVVLIWTVGGHTYGVGFHNMHGIPRTLALDKALAKGIRLIGP
jgi:hypothetical protein